MASARDTGWEALQQGNIEEAILLLELACGEDPSDYEAHLNLGAAYGRAGRHEEAISALAAAVRLQPANAQARCDLGVAMERAGHIERALDAFRQAVLLDSGCKEAFEAVRRLETSNASPSLPSPQPGPRSPTEPAIASAAPSSTAPLFGFELDEPASEPGFEASAVGRTAALPSHGLLSDYSPSPHAPRGPTAVSAPYSPEMPPPNYDDEINIPRTFRDFGRILVAPDRFFREQAGRNGLMAPILMVGLYLVLQLLDIVIRGGAQGIFTFVASIAVSPFQLAAAGMGMLVAYLISALLVHFLGWIFGNRQDYAVSVRACVFADAPQRLLFFVSSLYMAFVMVPYIVAHPITQAETEQAMGLPAGTMGGAGVGGPGFGGVGYTQGAAGPVVITTNPGTSSEPSASGNTLVRTETVTITTNPGTSPAPSTGASSPIVGGGRLRRTVRSAATHTSGQAAGGPRSVTVKSSPSPRLSPALFTGLARLVWRRFGGVIAFWLGITVVGWLWSSVLLALAIHRLQRIRAAAAAGVVVLMVTLELLLLFVIGLALRGLATSLFHLIFQSQGGHGAGGTGP